MATTEDIKQLESKIDKLVSDQSTLTAEVARLTGVVETQLSTHGGQIGALFDHRHEIDKRVSAIERDYITHSRCQINGDQNGREHREMREAIDKIKTQVTKILAIAGALWAIISVAMERYK